MGNKRVIPLEVPREVFTQKGALRKRLRVAARRGLLNALLFNQRQISLAAPTGVQGILGNSLGVPPTIQETPDGLNGFLTAISYALFIDEGFGGKGKFPPKDAIERWVRIKGVHKSLDPKPWMKKILPEKVRSKSKEKFTTKELLWLATYFVRRKIAQVGVKGTGFITQTAIQNRTASENQFLQGFKGFGK